MTNFSQKTIFIFPGKTTKDIYWLRMNNLKSMKTQEVRQEYSRKKVEKEHFQEESKGARKKKNS